MLFTFHHHGRAFAIETTGLLAVRVTRTRPPTTWPDGIEAHSPTQTGVLHTALAETQDDEARSYRIAELDEAGAAIAAAMAGTLDGQQAAPGQAITLRAAFAEQITTQEARTIAA